MRKILVVDDDKDLLDMVAMALSRLGYDIIKLTKGKAFFEALESFRPDIILLDVFLGDADGRNLCYQMKMQPAYHNIPVILYSAAQIPLSSVENSKADEFVTKPFDTHQLVEKIKHLLGI